MKLTLTPTGIIDRACGIPGARWEGQTETGTDIVVWMRAMEIAGDRNYFRLTLRHDPDLESLPGMFRAMLFDTEDGSGAIGALADDPLGGTLWTDKDARHRLLGAIGSAAANTTENRKRLSWVVVAHNKSAAIEKADKALYEAMRLALIAERQQCRAIAAEHSPEAAEAIVNRPLPPPWGDR